MFRKPHRSDPDFNEEVQAHLRIEAERLIEEGMDRKEAVAAAQRVFGNVTSTRERFYEARRWMWLDHFTRDIRYALRQVRRSPVSTVTIILSLALGIGVNTAIFSLADQALLRVLPVDKPEALVLLDWNGRFVGHGRGSGNLLPHPFFRELREENDVFTDMFARHPTDVHLSIGNESEPVSGELVSGSYFSTLGVQPALGRLLTDADDLQPGAHSVVVLAYDYWQTRLGGNPEIVGQRVLVNDFPMTVVGVAQQGFHGVDWSGVPAIWIPTMMQRQATAGWESLSNRRERWLHVFGRLKPGIDLEHAEARLQPWFKAHLRADTEREGWPLVTAQQMTEYMASSLDVLPAEHGRSNMQRQIEQPLLILLAATGLILLLACLNVANLSIARALARRRATALRAALGASRGRIITEQLVESAVLAAAGGVLGAVLAPSVSRVFLSLLPQQGSALSADLDVRVLLFALAITALTTLLFGGVPALYAASVRPVNALKEQSSAVTGGLGVRKALVVGQCALALILLIGAGLFVRTLGTFRAQGPGFPTSNLLMFRVDPLRDGYDAAKSKPLVRRLLTEIEALPDVEQAGVAVYEILTEGAWKNPVTVESTQRLVTEEDIPMNAVSAGFFDTLGVPVTRGRNFDERDARDDSDGRSRDWRGGLRSVIVNDEFVKRYLPHVDPIGARLGIGGGPDTEPDIEIVGVINTYHNRSLRQPEGEVFFSLWERSVELGTFYVRSRSSSEAAARSIRGAVRRIDPTLTVLSLRTIDDQLDRLLVTERLLATLAGAFAVVATLLAMIGLYGVLSFSAARRTKEMGIRLALGASRWAAGGLIVREAAVLAVAGLAIAIPASWALGRLIEHQLFGVRAMDAMTMVAAAAVLLLVCLAASASAARKAGTVSPLEALRSE
ncbi:MAG: FtsX-like permease family protein [Luteitalea sp.]|nr:FtsX-like permease family protein [Luteitalea sp.]